MAYNRIHSGSMISGIYDGADPLDCIPAPPARHCTVCGTKLAQRNKENLCYLHLTLQTRETLFTAAARYLKIDDPERMQAPAAESAPAAPRAPRVPLPRRGPRRIGRPIAPAHSRSEQWVAEMLADWRREPMTAGRQAAR